MPTTRQLLDLTTPLRRWSPAYSGGPPNVYTVTASGGLSFGGAASVHVAYAAPAAGGLSYGGRPIYAGLTKATGGRSHGGAASSTFVNVFLSLNPGRIPPSATSTVTFIGTGTTWNTNAPTFTAAGAPASDGSWSVGTVTVISDTSATAPVTAGVTVGTVTWTDSAYGETAQQTIATSVNKGEIVAIYRSHWIRRRRP
jgi:hypothetical protein